MRKLLCAALLLTAPIALSAQAYNSLWKKFTDPAQTRDRPALQANHFLSYTIAEEGIKDMLRAAPANYEHAIILDLPAPDGSFRAFRVWNTPVMAEALAKNFPEITTYTAEAVGAQYITAKLDYSPAGFHALVFDGSDTYFIEPYSRTADGAYVVCYKKDLSRAATPQAACGVTDGADGPHSPAQSANMSGAPAFRLNGTVRRKYRLALACTGEYATTVAGPTPTTAAVLANLVSVVNRANGIFERELAMTLELVANETNIIYLDGTTDPYTNSNTSQMLGENQANLDSRIGSANYDIGHALNISGLGLGQIGCVCASGGKARGVSFGSGTTTYQIMAHEMGHQFSANHTFNGSAGSCAGNGVASTAFEPGGGSTIMAYPGLCSTDNFQNTRDDYYHSRSLEDISTYIVNSGTCPTITTSTNTNAALPAFSATYAIPFKTPFELTAPAATDATKDTLTWCWEERDLGNFGQSLASTTTFGPLFRTFPAATSRTRVFPQIETVIGKKPLNGEKVADVPRSMVFKVVERDIYQGWGAFNYPDDTIRLNVIDTKVPFTVTYPVGGEVLRAASWPTVRWNVAGTTAAPISCANVDIYLSVDSGITYPYLIRANTQNDGLETVFIPNIASTTKARIKVKCSNNVFFNISAANFTVQAASAVTQTFLADNVLISPVPARDVLHIDIPAGAGAMQMHVTNTIGQTLWTGTVNAHASLDVSHWVRGFYQVHIYNESGVQIRRKVVVE